VFTESHLQILYVEDHVDTGDMISRWLSHHGHVVVLANTATDAEAKAKAHCGSDTFDLLILDLGLPELSGWDLLPMLRKMCDAPAVAFSGYGMHSDQEKSREAGFHAHLLKPVDLEALMDAIIAATTSRNIPPKIKPSP
jgi:CheY-like chemotaxis protein